MVGTPFSRDGCVSTMGKLFACDGSPFACQGGGGVGQQGVSGGFPSGAGVGEPVDDQGGFLLVLLVLVMCRGLCAAPGGTQLPEVAEGDRVGAGFGEEVAAVAEHVCPAAQPNPVFVGAEGPAGGYESFSVGAGGVGVQVDRFGVEPAGGVAGSLGGFGGVFGQVAGGSPV